MSQYKYSKKRKKGEHLTYIDRQKLEMLIRENEYRPKRKRRSLREMAWLLQSSPATLSREIRRGRVGPLYGKELEQYYSYSADVAQDDYDYKASGKGRELKLGKDFAFAEYVSQQILTHRQSPDAIIMRLRRDGNPFQTDICTRSLYTYIRKAVIPGVELKDLPRSGRQAKRGYSRLRKAFHGDGKSIEERPERADKREEAGHWEMDCIVSGKGKSRSALLVMVERQHRTCIIEKLRTQTSSAVIRVLDQLERKMGYRAFADKFKSITTDNGSEFLDWRSVEASCLTGKKRTMQYYCHPYSSWERGSVEQINGLIRRFIPKGTDISKLTKKKVQWVENWLNDLPRRILNGNSAKIASARAEAA